MAHTRVICSLVSAALTALAGSAALGQSSLPPGVVQEGQYEPGTLGIQAQPAPRPSTEGTVYGVGSWPTYPAVLAEGDGQGLVQGFCGACHSPTYITMQPLLPGSTWEAEVHKMIHTFGASIPEETAKQIIAYLKAHYAVETRRD
jgi:mono/diheme cytochrome c family protein